MFASGGYDHGVHLWTLKDDLSSASPLQLAIKHNSVVQSLVPIRDTSHKLVSASADNNVHIWDLSSERIVNTVKTSNSVFHAHPTSSPFCILLEVGASRPFHISYNLTMLTLGCPPRITIRVAGLPTSTRNTCAAVRLRDPADAWQVHQR
jgi:WD40 repeat protein